MATAVPLESVVFPSSTAVPEATLSTSVAEYVTVIGCPMSYEPLLEGAVNVYEIAGPARSSRTCCVNVETLPARLVTWTATVDRPSGPRAAVTRVREGWGAP